MRRAASSPCSALQGIFKPRGLSSIPRQTPADTLDRPAGPRPGGDPVAESKLLLALAKGKKEYDRRETIKRRETERETRAAIKERQR